MAYTAYYGRLSLIERSSDVNESEGNFKNSTSDLHFVNSDAHTFTPAMTSQEMVSVGLDLIPTRSALAAIAEKPRYSMRQRKKIDYFPDETGMCQKQPIYYYCYSAFAHNNNYHNRSIYIINADGSARVGPPIEFTFCFFWTEQGKHFVQTMHLLTGHDY